MSAVSITLGRPEDTARPWLQPAQLQDQETLRSWRNAHTQSFFQQDPVTPNGQALWYEAYLNRTEDYLFMVMQAAHAIGCIGLRFRDGEWELYNVLRGISSDSSKGFMSQALAMVVDFALCTRLAPVRVQVLANNPALAWYLSNQFVIVGSDARSVKLVYQPSDNCQKRVRL